MWLYVCRLCVVVYMWFYVCMCMYMYVGQLLVRWRRWNYFEKLFWSTILKILFLFSIFKIVLKTILPITFTWHKTWRECVLCVLLYLAPCVSLECVLLYLTQWHPRPPNIFVLSPSRYLFKPDMFRLSQNPIHHHPCHWFDTWTSPLT